MRFTVTRLVSGRRVDNPFGQIEPCISRWRQLREYGGDGRMHNSAMPCKVTPQMDIGLACGLGSSRMTNVVVIFG